MFDHSKCFTLPVCIPSFTPAHAHRCQNNQWNSDKCLGTFIHQRFRKYFYSISLRFSIFLKDTFPCNIQECGIKLTTFVSLEQTQIRVQGMSRIKAKSYHSQTSYFVGLLLEDVRKKRIWKDLKKQNVFFKWDDGRVIDDRLTTLGWHVIQASVAGGISTRSVWTAESVFTITSGSSIRIWYVLQCLPCYSLVWLKK